jgi:hypothetical protein
VQQGANGLIWQRNRALLVAVVKLEKARKSLNSQLEELLAAAKNVRERLSSYLLCYLVAQ